VKVEVLVAQDPEAMMSLTLTAKILASGRSLES
jgi:hypothetical protein